MIRGPYDLLVPATRGPPSSVCRRIETTILYHEIISVYVP